MTVYTYTNRDKQSYKKLVWPLWKSIYHPKFGEIGNIWEVGKMGKHEKKVGNLATYFVMWKK